MTSATVQAHPEVAGLFFGAPAVAYALHTAAHPAYRQALATLDRSIDSLIRGRLVTAHRRIDQGQIAAAREYDLIAGLTGLGIYLLHRHQEHELLRDVLVYLVRLTNPLRAGGEALPGWWATGSPDRRQAPRWKDGHAGFGMAHGISGPLALLSIAMRRGVIVDGHHDAIREICTWLDQWRTPLSYCPSWPEVISRNEHRAQITQPADPRRPSWCYGTPGIARAQHLAGQALNDTKRKRTAEDALMGCLADHQLARLTDTGLCHGLAGLIHTCRRVQAETGNPELATAVGAAARRLQQHLRRHGQPIDEGFLEGRAGLTLLEDDYNSASLTSPRWDTCLLTTDHSRSEGAE